MVDPKSASEFETFRQKIQAATDELLAAAEYHLWVTRPRLTAEQIAEIRKSGREEDNHG